MSHIYTRSGRRVDLLNPSPEDIRLDDIAYTLAGINRFTGHTRYTVAEHSVNCSILSDDPRWGLAHDFAEAYIGDVSFPLKSLLPDYRYIEAKWEGFIAERFGLKLPIPEDVRVVDKKLAATELYQFFGVDNGEPRYDYFPLALDKPYERFLERCEKMGLR